MPKAIALYSGGLDSILAILLVRRQGIDVTAVTFQTHFGCADSGTPAWRETLLSTATQFGFDLIVQDTAEKFLFIVRNPKFGYGKNLNPCLDCKILMLKEAGDLMRSRGADFLVTGEVLFQRPMSQRRDTFPRIDKEAGVEGFVLRPLSAKLLKPTIPENEGLIDRERLYSISGRGRKTQISLAKELGVESYPQPAGGCLLTDPIFSFRLRELMAVNPEPGIRDLELLRSGRHFRLSADCLVVVGRNERDNDRLEELAGPDDCLLEVESAGSPITLVTGTPSPEDLVLAASLCARYSDAKKQRIVEVTVTKDGKKSVLAVPPATDDLPDKYRIGQK